MSPVLLRPIREQIEHDRVIRLLQGRLRRRHAVSTNIGDEPEPTGVKSRGGQLYPDLVLVNSGSPRRLHGIVEVETTESVNRLEAMAEWAPFAKVRGAFYLYVPAGTSDVAKRLCEQHGASVTEIWSYHPVGEQIRFTLAYRSSRGSSTRRGGGKAQPTGTGMNATNLSGTPKAAPRKVKATKAVSRKVKATKAVSRKAKATKAAPRKVQATKAVPRKAKASSRARRKMKTLVAQVRTLVKKAASSRSNKSR